MARISGGEDARWGPFRHDAKSQKFSRIRCWRADRLWDGGSHKRSARPLKTFTARTIGTVAGLAKACAQVRAAGYIVDDEEYLEGVRCVAAPIRDQDGVIIASIGISAPRMRVPATHDRQFGRHVREVADRVTALLRAEGE